MVKVEDICRTYKTAGLYTHVYASCGFLYEDKDLFSFELSDDSKSVFDLASVTKAIVTTPLVLWHCHGRGMDPRSAKLTDVFGVLPVAEVGALSHNLPVADYLRHQTGLPFWRNFYVECFHRRQKLKDVLTHCASATMSPEVYSDVGFITLGDILEKCTGKSLLEEWHEVTNRMSIPSANQMGPGKFFDSRMVIPTGFCPVRRRELCGEVHDENCWALGGFKGHAGLFASGPALSAFLRELWSSDHGRAIFEENFKESNSQGDSLMGWRKGKDTSSSPFAEGRGCGHLGFTGTAFWVDPVTKAYTVVLTNRVISGRISPVIRSFRAEILGALWQIIQKSL